MIRLATRPSATLPSSRSRHVCAEPGKRGGGEVPGRRLGAEIVLVVAGHRDVDADGLHHLDHVRALGEGRHQRWREEVPTEGGDRVRGDRPLAPKEGHQRSDPSNPALRLVLGHVVDVEEGDRRRLGVNRGRHRHEHADENPRDHGPQGLHDDSSCQGFRNGGSQRAGRGAMSAAGGAAGRLRVAHEAPCRPVAPAQAHGRGESLQKRVVNPCHAAVLSALDEEERPRPLVRLLVSGRPRSPGRRIEDQPERAPLAEPQGTVLGPHRHHPQSCALEILPRDSRC